MDNILGHRPATKIDASQSIRPVTAITPAPSDEDDEDQEDQSSEIRSWLTQLLFSII